MKSGVAALIRDQLKSFPPIVDADLSGKNVLVIGANTGLGLEAVKYFARMKPARIILACRNEKKGTAAIKEIEAATGYKQTSLMLVDLASFASVDAFVAKVEAEQLAVDITVINAAVVMDKYEKTVDGWETTLQVNVLSAMLLSVLLIPAALRAADARPGSNPRTVIPNSHLHYWAKIPKKATAAKTLLQELSKPELFVGGAQTVRYNQTKLLDLCITRALAEHLARTPIIAVGPNPGWCYSSLMRDFTGVVSAVDKFGKKLFARTTEEGSRAIVFAALGGGEEMRGAYINLQKVQEPSDEVLDGALQKRIWNEGVDILSKVSPAFKAAVEKYF